MIPRSSVKPINQLVHFDFVSILSNHFLLGRVPFSDLTMQYAVLLTAALLSERVNAAPKVLDEQASVTEDLHPEHRSY